MQMRDVLGLILGGGAGTRLYPLTKERAKPAVPLAGKYRLIDIPMSNCFNAGIDKIAILTQFNSASLHRHIYRTYNRDMFTSGWVQILAAEQTPEHREWYQGTADAVRKQLIEIKQANTKYTLVLAGDHLYRMNYAKFVQFHVDSEADITLAVQPVSANDAPSLGILKLDKSRQVVEFREKPPKDQLAGLESVEGTDKPYMGSMGIYVFTTKLLIELLEGSGNDFGKEIIPSALSTHRVMGHIFDGFWEDIGTIRRFYQVNLDLANPDSPFDFYSPKSPIYTRPRFLPASEVYGGRLERVLLGDGCRITDATIRDSVIGLRSIISNKAHVESTVMMGADFYETDEHKEENEQLGRPNIGVGAGSTIEGAIIDKNARIGRNVNIRKLEDREDDENDNWVAKEGLIIVPKNGVIPDGTVI